MMSPATQIVRRVAPAVVLAIAAMTCRADDREISAPSDVERSGVALVGKVLGALGYGLDEVDHWKRSFAATVDRLRATGAVRGDQRQRTRAIHEYLHGQILRGAYETSASDPVAALEGRSHNCASATALLVAMAREFGVEAYPVSVVGHVWCRVETADATFDVESTCRDWFVLLERRATTTHIDPLHLSPAWQAHRHRAATARPLDERAFLAVFHYNRGVRSLREGRFSEAATANLAALWLDWRCEPAYGNLAAALLGWSRAASEHGTAGASTALAR